jgi:hypothetical protein
MIQCLMADSQPVAIVRCSSRAFHPTSARLERTTQNHPLASTEVKSASWPAWTNDSESDVPTGFGFGIPKAAVQIKENSLIHVFQSPVHHGAWWAFT